MVVMVDGCQKAAGHCSFIPVIKSVLVISETKLRILYVVFIAVTF